MDFIDRILKHLMDSKWHSIEEIEKDISEPEHKIHHALDFLNEQEFINIQNNRIILTSKGFKLMEL